MTINKKYRANCSGCHAVIILYNYDGLDPESRMGSHHCIEQADIPEDKPLFYNEKEIK